MSARATTRDGFRLVLVASGAAAGLGAGLLARHLGLSEPEAARHDPVARGPPAVVGTPTRLNRTPARLGLARYRVTGAVAADIDRAMCGLLIARHPDAGLRTLNRDLARSDLVMPACPGSATKDVVRFLALRGLRDGARDGALIRGRIVETGLARAEAITFRAEYAAIGILTDLRLGGRPDHPGG